MKNLISNINFSKLSQNNKSPMILSFFIGTTISIIPFIFNLIENHKNNRLVYDELKIELKKIENYCKNTKSEYSKLLNLGFKNSAIDKFNECIENKLL